MGGANSWLLRRHEILWRNCYVLAAHCAAWFRSTPFHWKRLWETFRNCQRCPTGCRTAQQSPINQYKRISQKRPNEESSANWKSWEPHSTVRPIHFGTWITSHSSKSASQYNGECSNVGRKILLREERKKRRSVAKFTCLILCSYSVDRTIDPCNHIHSLLLFLFDESIAIDGKRHPEELPTEWCVRVGVKNKSWERREPKPGGTHSLTHCTIPHASSAQTADVTLTTSTHKREFRYELRPERWNKKSWN